MITVNENLMKSINKYLLIDEKIIWQRSLINPVNRKNIKAIYILGGISLILILPIFLLFLGNFSYPPVLIIGFFLILLSIILGLVSINFYFTYWKYMKTLNLKFKQIKTYEDSYLLTNKRWIQKSLDVLNFNEEKLPLQITKIKDVAFIEFDNIKSFFAIRRNASSCYFIGFDIEFPSAPGFFIPYEIYPEFIRALLELIPKKREVHKKNNTIFYYNQ